MILQRYKMWRNTYLKSNEIECISVGAWQDLWHFYSAAHAHIPNEHCCESRLRERSDLKDLRICNWFPTVLVKMPSATSSSRGTGKHHRQGAQQSYCPGYWSSKSGRQREIGQCLIMMAIISSSSCFVLAGRILVSAVGAPGEGTASPLLGQIAR